jgi:succinate-acetate transporter protein
MESQKLGNPAILGLGGFGFALFIAATVLLLAHGAEGAMIFALFIGFLDEYIAGMWSLARGETYIASIVSLFGSWLLGAFLLFTWGIPSGFFSEEAWAVWNFGLLTPIAFLGIPAFKERNWPIMLAFIFLWLLLFALGIAALGIAAESMTIFAGVMAYAAATALWYECVRIVGRL